MSREKLVFLLLLLLPVTLFPQIPTTLVDSLSATGFGPNSKRVIEENNIEKTLIYRIEQDKITSTKYRFFKAYYYNKEGRLVKEQILNKTGESDLTFTFTYDAKGKIIASDGFGFDGKKYFELTSSSDTAIFVTSLPNKEIDVDTIITLSGDNGRSIKKYFIHGTTSYSIYYYYTGQDKPERVDYFSKNGSITTSRIYHYHRHKNVAKLTIYTEEQGRKFKSMECYYDKKGRCIKSITLSTIPNSNYSSSTIYKFRYNLDGTLTEHTEEREKGQAKKIIYKYEYPKDM